MFLTFGILENALSFAEVTLQCDAIRLTMFLLFVLVSLLNEEMLPKPRVTASDGSKSAPKMTNHLLYVAPSRKMARALRARRRKRRKRTCR